MGRSHRLRRCAAKPAHRAFGASHRSELCHTSGAFGSAANHRRTSGGRSPWFLSIGRYIDLGLVILYVFFGFIVLLKAPRNTLSTLLVWMMMIWALVTVSADYGFTAPDNLSSYFVGSLC